MPALSTFDMFKIGVGPSSSHTMGPWRAAERFVAELGKDAAHATAIAVDLYGSLAKTGKGHGTDIAVQLGLAGYDPTTIDPDTIHDRIEQIKTAGCIAIAGRKVPFEARRDIRFHFDEQLPEHPNGLKFTATLDDNTQREAAFYSIGGGFVTREGETEEAKQAAALPYPIETAADLLGHCERQSLSIAEVVFRNERTWRDEPQIHDDLAAIRETMLASIHRGCRTEGTLPGGLKVVRRAAHGVRELLGVECPADRVLWTDRIRDQSRNFASVLDWVSCFALAVNEENAAFGRVVTAPTNGAAGVIPAVLLYYECFCDSDSRTEANAWADFLLTAAEIGCIFKKGATISAAMGGCQAEIGVSSAMAAAALAVGLGASPHQAAMAAEIAMEHHLGMTCDPVGGLVQIPCIERNAMGAIKAITAARIALNRDPHAARVTLDDVVHTMWNTAIDMNAKYKETSDGGLATQIPVSMSEC